MKALVERAKSSFPGRLLTAFGEGKAGNYAAGLAFCQKPRGFLSGCGGRGLSST
jgi:hypothetical protein